MSTSTFTPGPWTAEGFEQVTGNGDFYGGLIIGSDGETIVAQFVMPDNMPLISAAPDLLSELQNIANAKPETWDEEMRDQFQQWAQSRARKAIAKVLGE